MAMIQITFTPESAEEAAIIGEAMSRIMAISSQQMSIAPAETKEPVAEAPKRTRATKATPAPAATAEASAPEEPTHSPSAAVQTTAQTEVTEDPKPAAEPSVQEAPAAQTVSSPAPSVSLEEVRAKLAELSQAGKQQQVVALIASMGARKLTEIPAEKYGKLMAEANNL
jgi:hypothetical protein